MLLKCQFFRQHKTATSLFSFVLVVRPIPSFLLSLGRSL
nr:MAG TPA: hypothetical protein [Caudoviricetes sp.]